MSTAGQIAPPVPGLLVRAQTRSLYFIPATELDRYLMPPELQSGTPEGDRVQHALDQCGPVHKVANALMTQDGIVQDIDPASPTHGKEKFAPDIFEALPATSPQGAKEKFVGGVFGD
jgi:hypothetical protein